MIHRFIFILTFADALFLLALSGAVYHHTGAIWSLYVIYFAAVVAFGKFFEDMASWAKYIGDKIGHLAEAHRSLAKAHDFHAKCIRDKVVMEVHHKGQIQVDDN